MAAWNAAPGSAFAFGTRQHRPSAPPPLTIPFRTLLLVYRPPPNWARRRFRRFVSVGASVPAGDRLVVRRVRQSLAEQQRPRSWPSACYRAGTHVDAIFKHAPRNSKSTVTSRYSAPGASFRRIVLEMKNQPPHRTWHLHLRHSRK